MTSRPNTPQPRPGIMDIAPYVGGLSKLPGREQVIKLSSNEGALGPSPKALKAYDAAAKTLQRYPDDHCKDLREALGARHAIDAERIVCGAGSDDIITVLCRSYAGPGDEVLVSEHGFLVYPIAAKAAGADVVVAPEKDLTSNVDALLDCVSDKTRIVFLANPNNPTGTYIGQDELERLRRSLPGDVLLVIDSAYAEFATRDDYSCGVDLVDAGENTVMTRTFSKIYGLGGVRLGWAYCPENICGVFMRSRTPFTVSAPAQAAGLAALKDAAFIKKAQDHNDAWLTWTTDKLQKMGLETTPSTANFVLAHFPEGGKHTALAANAFLQERGIIVRVVEAYGFPNALRITIGLEAEMRALSDALDAFMKT
jgi:histidinol-phosphate aminotransferase